MSNISSLKSNLLKKNPTNTQKPLQEIVIQSLFLILKKDTTKTQETRHKLKIAYTG